MKKQQLLAAILCAATPLAYAETTDNIVTLDEIVVTATRFNNLPESSSVNVTVITAEEIKNNAAKTLPDLLAQHAGIQVRSNDGTQDKTVDLRGFGVTGMQNSLVLLDGQQLNDIELTSVHWSAIPLDSIERIEIVNGSGAVLYGAGATGGTINIITKKSAKNSKGAVSVDLGSYNSKEGQLSLGMNGERVSAHITASSLDTDNYRANNRVAQSNVEGDVRTEMGKGNAVFKFGADSQNLRLPGSRTVNPTAGTDELATNPRGAQTPLDYGKRQGGHVSVGTNQQLGFGEVAVELAFRNKDQQAYYAAGSYLDTNLHVLSLTPRFKMPHQIGMKDSELIVGADLADWSYDSRRSSSHANISTPTTQILSEQSNRALYAQNTTKLGANTKLTLGARSQRAEYQASDAANSSAYASSSQGRTVNVYELGLRHALHPTLSLFGRAGRSFRIATVDEIFDQFGGSLFDSKITMLEPQTSQDRELGLDYKNSANKVHAVLYQMDLNNEIHYNALTFSNVNLSPTRRYGFELEGRHAYTDALEVDAAYSYTVAKFREGVYGGVDVSGNNIPLVPRQRLALSTSLNLSEKTSVNGNALYVSEQYFDNDQANNFGKKMPAYVTVDMKLSHQTGAWLLAASVNNLFNKHYFTYAVRSNFTAGKYNAYPMPERNFTISAKYQF